MQLISVILGGKTSDIRFSEASKQLDYGFAKYEVVDLKTDISITPIKVLKGKKDNVSLITNEDLSMVIDKGTAKNIEKKLEMAADVKAPVEKGQKLGEMVVSQDGKEIKRISYIAESEIEKAGVYSYFKKLMN